MVEDEKNSQSTCIITDTRVRIHIPEFFKPLHEFEVILHFASVRVVGAGGMVSLGSSETRYGM